MYIFSTAGVFLIYTWYDLAHVAQWERYHLFSLAHISCVRYALHRSSCTAFS